MGFYGCVLEKIDRSIYASYKAKRCASSFFSNPSRLAAETPSETTESSVKCHGRLFLVPLIQGLFSLQEKAKTTVL